MSHWNILHHLWANQLTWSLVAEILNKQHYIISLLGIFIIGGDGNIKMMVVWWDVATIALFLDLTGLYAHFVVAPQGSVYPPSILGKLGEMLSVGFWSTDVAVRWFCSFQSVPGILNLGPSNILYIAIHPTIGRGQHQKRGRQTRKTSRTQNLGRTAHR